MPFVGKMITMWSFDEENNLERERTIFLFFYTWTPFFSPYEKINDKSYKTLTRLWMARQNMWNEGV